MSELFLRQNIAWEWLRDIPRDFRCVVLWGSCSFGANLSELSEDGMMLLLLTESGEHLSSLKDEIFVYGIKNCLKESTKRQRAFEMASTLRFHVAGGYGTSQSSGTYQVVDDDFTNVFVALLQGALYNLIRFGDQRVNISVVSELCYFIVVIFLLLTSKIQSLRKSKCY